MSAPQASTISSKRQKTSKPALSASQLQELQEKAVELLLASNLPTTAQLVRVSSITFSSETATAEMQFHPRTGKATILLNPSFVSQHADSGLRLAALLCHELFHHLLHHYVFYPQDTVSNLAQDILINGLICRIASNFQQLFTDCYDKNCFPWMLLRPGANIRAIKCQEIREPVLSFYRSFYRRYNRYFVHGLAAGQPDPDTYTVDDIRSLLEAAAMIQERIQTQNLAQGLEEMHGLGGCDPDWWRKGSPLSVLLLGDHRGTQTDDSLSTQEMDEDSAADLQETLRGIIGDLSANPNAKGLFEKGFKIDSEKSPEELAKALEAGMREEIMRSQEITETIVGQRPSLVSVVPVHWGRREVALWSAGVWPIFFPAFGQEQKPQGDVILYLDVSGSMGDQAEFLLMLMTNFKEKIDTVFYQFSTEIAETPYQEFVQHFEQTGEVFVKTTGGTDFDPIFAHAEEHGFKKIVVITDGAASLSEDRVQFAKGIQTYTVFTHKHQPEPLSEVSIQTWVMPTLKLKRTA